MKYLLCIVYMTFSLSGLIFIKLGSLNINPCFNIPLLEITLNRESIIGIICYGISFLLYLGILNQFDLGVIVPIIAGLVNIGVLLASFFIFKERLSINSIAGAIIIILGIFIMNIKK
ncbi:4-amino-4-deoxy-L-arabinose-phosphoundecaprenol flippase subunit ArnE [Lachnospiraceae bacterium]|nr:4-amino-4-deoxy-L-arabinose-phosphoundecaprenol flippase subunit ArnE [Lachnospiraceae bacterium]